MTEFQFPWAFLLILLLPIAAWMMLRKDRVAAIKFSSFTDIQSCQRSWKVRLRWLPIAFRILCLLLLIVAIARPRKGINISQVSTEGVAIEVVVDRSGSMAQEMDYFGRKMNRLETVKEVLGKFIKGDKDLLSGRDGDLIGLISFARYADTLCPMVLSHDVLLEFLDSTKIVKQRSEDGTAVGDALALAAARLKKAEEEILKRSEKIKTLGSITSAKDDFKIKSKVIILLTDGINNAGEYDPLAAAKLAKDWDIKIYTIGIGSAAGRTVMGFQLPGRSSLDEALLKQIAQATGGFYGRANNADGLQKVVEKIDELEKTEVKTVRFMRYDEKFANWAMAALIVLGLEIFLRSIIFRVVP